LPANQDLTALKIDIGPTKTDDLAATGAEHDGEAQEQPQLGALFHRGRQQPGGVLGLRRLHVGLLHRRRGRQLGRVVADPAPHHRLLEGAGQDRVDLVDGAGLERPAVLAAPGPQVGIEGVQGGGVDLADGELAEGREDVAVHGRPVAADRGGGDRPHGRPPLQPALQQLGHGPRP
jgi:hypothetical protein